MIRFPERFHGHPFEGRACEGLEEEPNWRESQRVDPSHRRGSEHCGRRREHFDFTALAAALKH